MTVNADNAVGPDRIPTERRMAIGGPLVAGVAAQRVIVGHLHEDQHHPVGVDDVHLVQPPGFAAGLAGDLDSALLELCLRCLQVTYL